MIFNQNELFSFNQAITATANSTNVIDRGVPGTPYQAAATLNDDIGKGNMIPLLVQVTEDFNTLTSLTIQLQTGASASLGTTLLEQTISLADLKAGRQFNLTYLPQGIEERYLGVNYVVTGTAPTAGQVTAGITMGVQTNVTGA